MRSEIEFWGRKGGYTSLVADMGVQWDFKANCGLRVLRRFPVAALIPDPFLEPWPEPGEKIPGVGTHIYRYRSLRCSHKWMIGDYISVCSKCMAEIEHGDDVPAFGMPPKKRSESSVD